MKTPLSPAQLMENSPLYCPVPGCVEQKDGVAVLGGVGDTQERKKLLFSLCEVCNIQLNSAAQAQTHYNGKSHLRRVKQLNNGEMPQASGPLPLSTNSSSCSTGFRQTSEFDVICHSGTQMHVSMVTFAFREQKEPVVTLSQVKAMQCHSHINSIRVKVTNVATTSETIQLRGEAQKMVQVAVNDHTAGLKLQTWNDESSELQTGTSYLITDVSTRHFSGETFLTTTRNTTITETEAIELPCTSEPVNLSPVHSVIECKVLAADIQVKWKCSVCKHTQGDGVDIRHKFHRCLSCGRKQLTANLEKISSGKVTVVESKACVDYKVAHKAIISYLSQIHKLDVLDNRDIIEELLIEQSKVQLILDTEDLIIDIKVCADSVYNTDAVADMAEASGSG